jgi:hypothetical protein
VCTERGCCLPNREILCKHRYNLRQKEHMMLLRRGPQTGRIRAMHQSNEEEGERGRQKEPEREREREREREI